MNPSPKWTLDARAFELLLAALAPERDAAAIRYEELRLRLIRVLRWERTSEPETLADEAFTRLARRLAEGESVAEVPAYLNGIARFLVKEDRAQRQRTLPLEGDHPARDSAAQETESAHAALERCLAALDRPQRSLVLGYYEGDQMMRIRNRQKLAASLGLALNALRNRALRLREKLEACVRAQLARDESGTDATRNKGTA
jgi:DNA-directed RNA polymerase specialized sigma24 family protein